MITANDNTHTNIMRSTRQVIEYTHGQWVLCKTDQVMYMGNGLYITTCYSPQHLNTYYKQRLKMALRKYRLFIRAQQAHETVQ